MRVTFNIFGGAGDQDSLITLEIFPDMTIETVQQSLHAETNIPVSSQQIYFGGRLVTDTSRTMEQLGVSENDVLALHVRRARQPRPAAPAAAAAPAPQATNQAQGQNRPPMDPELIRLGLLEDQAARNSLRGQHPELAAAVDNPAEFLRIFRETQDRETRERQERQREIAQLNLDPFNQEYQKKIEEMIRQERVIENLQSAMEHNPEVFGRVHMLYLDVEVNGHRVKALVDSGAQATIMSPACAEACNIMRLVDTRFAGVARGVGTANILGRVHSAQIKIGNLYLPCSFTVMEGKSVDLLLGLDMLKRFQATIDLGKDRLIIQGEEVPFLGEADIPKDDETAPEEPTIAGPSGTAVGQHSGAVFAPQAQQPAQQPPQQPAQHQFQQPPQVSAPQPTPAAPQVQPASDPQVSPDHVNSLVAMGIPRAQAIQALVASDGDMNVAVGILFGET